LTSPVSAVPSVSAALAAALIGGTAAAATQAAPRPAFPVFASAAALTAACEAGLVDAARRVRSFERHRPDARWLAAWDDLNAVIEDASAPIALLENVHPDKAVRDAAQACNQRWSEFASTLGQNETVYRALKRVRPRDAIDRELVEFSLERFEDAGVGLAPAERARAKEINDRVADLVRQFDARIRDANVQVPVAVDELAGAPADVWQTKPRDGDGRVVLGLDNPTVKAVLEHADDASLRERMWRAKTDEGGEANLGVLAEIARLRRDYAQLLGMRSFAEFQQRRGMVESPATTTRFLADVRAAVQARALRDLAELRDAKSRHLGTPVAATRIERWDVGYYLERRRRERFGVDQEAFRAYFPPAESLKFVMRIVEKMLGVRYSHLPESLWHEDAQVYAVSDAGTGRPIAVLYVDLYPRDGKYNHAAVWDVRSSATRTHRLPQAALVVNLDRHGLTLAELETLLHEMGHAVHNNLSATRDALLASATVQFDFGEAPSQMLEEWVYDARVVKLFATSARRAGAFLTR